jgi:hypothetical protein
MPQLKVRERLELTFKNTRELNKLIDDHLPGRSPFQHHELVVDEEVCEVYFRDILACIRGLFGDPDFAPYLIFTPEKHYADIEKQERMYHDMHTGKWWWSTQVSYRMYISCKVDCGESVRGGFDTLRDSRETVVNHSILSV